MTGTAFVRTTAPRGVNVLYHTFQGLVVLLAVWRTAVVDWHVWYAPVAWLADLLGLATGALFLFTIRYRATPVPRPVPTRHTVDVLVPTLNEPPAVLEPTLLAATRIRGVRRVLVLDDGHRPEVARIAQRLGVEYVTRGTRAGAKAGNLNHALPKTDAELIATFDADHIPLPQFLERTTGYFDDPTVAFVQTPQAFYNTDSVTFGRHWHEQQMFYGCVQPAKNATNSAFYTGTNAVLRRAALADIGGFATGTATEDIHTSLRLHAHGWRSVFVPTPLAYGLEVDNLREYYGTRRRWAAGSLGLLFRSRDSPLRIRGLTCHQRLNYISSTVAHLQGIQRLVYLVVPALTLATLDNPVNVSFAGYGAVFAGFAALSLWLIHRYAYGAYRPWDAEMFNLGAALPQLAGLVGLLRVERKFRVSTKNAGRSPGAGIKVAYGVLLAIGAAGLARCAELLLTGTRTGLVTWSGAFLAINTTLLLSLVIRATRYEHRGAVPTHAQLDPEALYRHVVQRGKDKPGTSCR
jgi:cellulose synthase (UDP-forming)